MTSTALKRINRDLKTLETTPVAGCTAKPKGDDMFLWACTVTGPSDSPYANGSFHFEIIFPPEYPFKAPKVKWLTEIFHPSINQPKNEICLGEIIEKFAPTQSVATILEAIKALLQDPRSGADHPLNADAGALVQQDIAKFNAKAKEMTKKFAS